MFDQEMLRRAVVAGVACDPPPFRPDAIRARGDRPSRPRRHAATVLSAAVVLIPAAALAVVGARSVITMNARQVVVKANHVTEFLKPRVADMQRVARELSFPLTEPTGLPPGYSMDLLGFSDRDLVVISYQNKTQKREAVFFLQDPKSPEIRQAPAGSRAPRGYVPGFRFTLPAPSANAPRWVAHGERVILIYSHFTNAEIQHIRAEMMKL